MGLARILLAGVVHFLQGLLPVQGVAVHADFGVQAVQVTGLGDHQGVDFNERQVLFLEHLRQAQEDLHELLDLVALQAQFEGQFPALVGLCSHQRVDGRAQDFLGSLLGHLLDFHAAFGGSHEDHPARGAIDHGAQVQFVGDISAGLNQYLAHRLAVGIGLVGDQVLAQPLGGEFARLVGALDELYPTRLAATAGMYLGFYHPHIPADLLCCRCRVFGGIHCITPGNRQPVLGKQLLALILMKVHLLSCSRLLLCLLWETRVR